MRQRCGPARDLAEEQHRQRDHEQRPRELQRHRVGEQHVGQRPEEAGVADRAGRAAHEVHAGPLGAQRLKRIRANNASTNRKPIAERKNKISIEGMLEPRCLMTSAIATSVIEPVETRSIPRELLLMASQRARNGFWKSGMSNGTQRRRRFFRKRRDRLAALSDDWQHSRCRRPRESGDP